MSGDPDSNDNSDINWLFYFLASYDSIHPAYSPGMLSDSVETCEWRCWKI